MDWLWLIFLAALGACVGSFLNVVIYRLPRGESLVFPGSRCPSCGRGIRWYDNIPLASWLALRGRCRHCRATIRLRYFVIEAATAILVAGLYACYYLLDVRGGAGRFDQTWPMYAAHAALLCGLLACLAVDLELWIIPLEVTWFCAAVGIASAAFRPHPFLPRVATTTIASSLAAVAGLALAWLLVRLGYLQPSFVGAREEPLLLPPAPSGPEKDAAPRAPLRGVAITKAHGVNPRIEALRELLFLAPALALAVGAAVILRFVPAARGAWDSLFDGSSHPFLAERLGAGGSAVFGFLIGGLWVWGARILGTLAFGKEAMGLGDAHLLAAAGAVFGWIVPSVAFFLAPFLGLLWALYLWIARSQRELPYGPWLAAALVLVLLGYDLLADLAAPYAATMRLLFSNG